MHGVTKMITKNGYMKLEVDWGDGAMGDREYIVMYCIYRRCAVCDIRDSIIIEDAKAIVCIQSSVSLFALSGIGKKHQCKLQA